MTGRDLDVPDAAPASSALVVRPGEGAGPVRWDMSVEDLVAVLGPPTDCRRSPGAPDRLTWAGAGPGGSGEPGGLVVEADGAELVSVGVDGSVVQVDGREHDLRDPRVLAEQDPLLHDDAQVFLDWGVELWGAGPEQSGYLRVLAPGPLAELRVASVGAARYTQVQATTRSLPTADRPWTVLPGTGVGPLLFGMTQTQVGALLGPAEKGVVVQGRPREVRGDLVCVFEPDDGLAEVRWTGLGAVHLDGAPLAARGKDGPDPLTRSVPLVNRSWDVHVDLGLAVQRGVGARGDVVVFAASRTWLWTNLHRPLV